jgi:hypothetical protein
MTRAFVIDALKRNPRRPRQHASYFDWDDNTQKEIGICVGLVEHLEAEADWDVDEIMPGDDPPDWA